MNCIVAASTDIGIVKNTNQDSFYAKAVETNRGKIAFAILENTIVINGSSIIFPFAINIF